MNTGLEFDRGRLRTTAILDHEETWMPWVTPKRGTYLLSGILRDTTFEQK